MPEIVLEDTFTLSKQQPAIRTVLRIVVDINPDEKCSAVGTTFDESIVAGLSSEVREVVLFDGVAAGVTAAWQHSAFLLPEDGSNLEVHLGDFSPSEDPHMLSEFELKALSRQLIHLVSENLRKLLDSMANEMPRSKLNSE